MVTNGIMGFIIPVA